MTESGNDIQLVYTQLQELMNSIQKLYIGQEEVVQQVLVCLLAQGHVLLEGVPGLGKTLLIRIMSRLIRAEYSRIQFTPDLMPADVTGHMLYDHQSGNFKVKKGPVFTNLLLADEINRSPAKTQAALLEVMEEKQVTLEGEPMKVGQPFMVMATQNPIEQEGTYILPEAQLDRFLLKIIINYPDEQHELQMLSEIADKDIFSKSESLDQLLDLDAIRVLQEHCANVLVDASVQKYILDIIRATRNSAAINYGAGPRGGIALLKCSRALALVNHRDYVLPDDVKKIAFPVLRHRIIISPEHELAGKTADNILSEIINQVDAPRQ